nr:MAG TPA: hypothetical protein [Crassvirales sp.]
MAGTFSNNNDLDLNISSIDNDNTNNGSGEGQQAVQQPISQQAAQSQGEGNANQQVQQSQQQQVQNQEGEGQQSQQQGQQQGDSSTGDAAVELQEGDNVEIDGATYTINNNGDAVGEDGQVFRTRAELAQLIASQATQEPSVLQTLQSKFGSEFTDENGNPIVFDDSIEGLNSYVETVVKARQEEAQQAALNSLFATYPQVEQALNYVKLNGSLEGFNEIPTERPALDKNNEEQLASVIREEWKLQNKRGDVNKFIDYCKSAGTLYETAVESDKVVGEINEAKLAETKAKVEAAEEAERKATEEYWNKVNETLTKGDLMGYAIPDQIQCNRDGKKVMLSKADFMKYISVPVDETGNTTYMLDEAKVAPEIAMQDDLLRAYLKFTGGNYSSLVGMAANKEQVLKLRTQAAQSTTAKRTIVINSNGSNSKHVDNDKLVLS